MIRVGTSCTANSLFRTVQSGLPSAESVHHVLQIHCVVPSSLGYPVQSRYIMYCKFIVSYCSVWTTQCRVDPARLSNKCSLARSQGVLIESEVLNYNDSPFKGIYERGHLQFSYASRNYFCPPLKKYNFYLGLRDLNAYYVV